MLDEVLSLLLDLAAAGLLRRAVFSRPSSGNPPRIDARLCTHKGNLLLATEHRASDGKIFHKNIPLDRWEAEIPQIAAPYRQINLISTLGDAEYKRNDKGKEVFLGGDKLRRAFAVQATTFADAVTETLFHKKNYILSGDEPFLAALGVSDQNGRVHDKKQAKFRQINRFLEHIRDIEGYLPKEGPLLIYDLCCGKSYLSFAVYHYFKNIRQREVEMLGMDLKDDCMRFCAEVAKTLDFDGMTFRTGDIRTLPRERAPHLVLSLHACDIATDIVLHFAASVRASVILSTPCCQHDLLGKMDLPALGFVTDYGKLSGKLAEALTDGLRLARLRTFGYTTSALELTDPDDTPKNTLLRAVLQRNFRMDSPEALAAKEEYAAALRFVLGRDATDYPEQIL